LTASVPIAHLEQAVVQQSPEQPVQRTDLEADLATRLTFYFLHKSVSVQQAIQERQEDMKIGWFERQVIACVSRDRWGMVYNDSVCRK